MRIRYGLAALFVALVAGMIAVRDAGYLGGRAESGPLTVSFRGQSAAPVGETSVVAVRLELDGDPVTLQNVEPDFVSPGFEYRAPRFGGDGRYPREGRLVEGGRLERDADISLGLRIVRPGEYFVQGLTVDYKRGARRFRAHVGGSLMCFSTGRQDCAGAPVRDGRLGDVGGPGRRGRGFVRLTLTNLTRSTYEVAELAAPGVTGTVPESFTLERGEARTVRLRTEGCPTIAELEAELDGEPATVPLSAPVRPRCRRGG